MYLSLGGFFVLRILTAIQINQSDYFSNTCDTHVIHI